MENLYENKMIKTLIVDDNLHYMKNMLNNILNKFENIQVLYMVSTCNESIDIISKNQIDLIFLDLRLPDYNGFKIIEKIEILDLIKKPKIIIVSGDTKLLKQAIINNNVAEIINKIDDIDNIYKKIERIVRDINYEVNREEIERKILKEVLNLGYKLKYKGTQYIIEAIRFIYACNNINLIDNLEQNIYKYLSVKYNKSINNIKTNIIKATNEREKEKKKLYNLTPKQAMLTILNRIKFNCPLM